MYVTYMTVLKIFDFYQRASQPKHKHIRWQILLHESPDNVQTGFPFFSPALMNLFELANDSLYTVAVVIKRSNDKLFQRFFGNVYPVAHYILSVTTVSTSWLIVSLALQRSVLLSLFSEILHDEPNLI